MGDVQDQIGEELLRPIHTNTFALPDDTGVKLAYAVYNPDKKSLLLNSEKGRTVFAEAFITNPRLGTLADLCIRALPKQTVPLNVTKLGGETRIQRLQYDAIDIEEPLENIYQIEDLKFWKKLTLAKTKDSGLKFKPNDFDWKKEGISLKFIELVESCPAEFWPEAKMRDLALKIKDFVTDMHIRHLQSLKDYSFDRYINYNDSDTDKTTSTDVSYTTDEEKFKKTNNQSKTSLLGEEEEEGEGEEELGAGAEAVGGVAEQDERNNSININEKHLTIHKAGSDDNLRHLERIQQRTEERRTERRARREAQILRREKREEKRQKREEEDEENKPKPKRIKIHDVFNLPIEEPIDDEDKKMDKRNLEKYLHHLKTYTYPPKHCHHISLKFLGYFENLVSFAIEFNPPELQEKYHTRHFNFSYEDVQNLASGIAKLEHLRIFRLRDSRMDGQKLEILAAVLKNLNVEVIDFGNDQLDDNSDEGLYDLFQNTITIKSLELEGNKLGTYSLRRLGKALKRYGGVLKYLGLGRNVIDTECLHGLCSKIVDTPQIEELVLSGVRVSEMGIFCCIADELLHRHKALRLLDLTAVPISARGGELILTALRTNYNVQTLECRGCNLDESIETDIALCVERNRYMSRNPYIGDHTKTAEDIEDFMEKNKNPIILAAMDEVNQHNTCLDVRPRVSERYSLHLTDSKKSGTATLKSSENEEKSSKIENQDTTSEETSGEEATTKIKQPFVYNANEFNAEEILKHVQLPGPGQRYNYFQTKNKLSCTYTD